MASELLRNVVMSSSPCPICADAGEQPPMTLDDWMTSDWGIPGGSTRYCEDDCHCVLMPEAVIAEFPAISNKVRLRGEEGSEIRPVVDIGPAENGLKEIVELWNQDIGKLPKTIYKMKLEDIEPFLRELYTRFKAGGTGAPIVTGRR